MSDYSVKSVQTKAYQDQRYVPFVPSSLLWRVSPGFTPRRRRHRIDSRAPHRLAGRPEAPPLLLSRLALIKWDHSLTSGPV